MQHIIHNVGIPSKVEHTLEEGRNTMKKFPAQVRAETHNSTTAGWVHNQLSYRAH